GRRAAAGRPAPRGRSPAAGPGARARRGTARRTAPVLLACGRRPGGRHRAIPGRAVGGPARTPSRGARFMKPNTRLALVAALAALPVLPPAVPAQQPWRADTRRERLEAEVLSRFVNRAARDLELDADGRARLESVLRASAERRRAIAQEARSLRQELDRTLRDPA